MGRRLVWSARLRHGVAVAVVVLASTGCGEGGDDGGAGAPSITSTTEAAAASTTTAAEASGGDAAAPATGNTVVIEGFTYQPPSVEVAAGTSVTWSNEDGVGHTVTAGRPGEEVTGFHEPVDVGATVEVTFDEPGTFPYYCAVHPTMTGEVVVS